MKTISFGISESSDKKLDELSAKHGISRSEIISGLLEKVTADDIDIQLPVKKTRCYDLPPYAIEKLRTLAEAHSVSDATVIEELCLTRLELG